MAAVLPHGAYVPHDSPLPQIQKKKKTPKLPVGLDARSVSNELHAYLVESGLIKDRRIRLRAFPKSFVGSEVVDWLLEYAEIETRSEAVGVFNYLLFKDTIYHVTEEGSAFEDGNVLYRFRQDGDSRKRRHSNALIYKASTSSSDGNSMRRRNTLGGAELLMEIDKRRTTTPTGKTFSMATCIAQALSPSLAGSCPLSGSSPSLVGTAVDSGISPTKLLTRLSKSTANLCQVSEPSTSPPTTTDDCKRPSQLSLFRCKPATRVSTGSFQNSACESISNSSSVSTLNAVDVCLENIEIDMDGDDEVYRDEEMAANTSRSYSSVSMGSLATQFMASKDDASKVASGMRAAMKTAGLIKERRYHFVIYPNSFLSCETVLWLQTFSNISNQQSALSLMSNLEAMGFIHHVTDSHPFGLESNVFRFRVDDGTELPEVSFDVIALGEDIYHQAKNTDPPTVCDRLYHGKIYPRCFIAKEFLDRLLQWDYFFSRKQAVDFCRKLVDAGMIHHVCFDHNFKDGYLFFRFTADIPQDSLDSTSVSNKRKPRRPTKYRRSVDSFTALRSPLTKDKVDTLIKDFSRVLTPIGSPSGEPSPSDELVVRDTRASSPLPALRTPLKSRPQQRPPSTGSSHDGSSSDPLETDDDDKDLCFHTFDVRYIKRCPDVRQCCSRSDTGLLSRSKADGEFSRKRSASLPATLGDGDFV